MNRIVTRHTTLEQARKSCPCFYGLTLGKLVLDDSMNRRVQAQALTEISRYTVKLLDEIDALQL
ncbi:hypothetical protein M0G41_01455 [Lysobacter sp. CAU 1642]|uniref:Uncharacterized protein n=1 Tax=Pseudomarimonas salicorniae TaxID=2933270 RepID=A0ABT0GCS5_9GAMM|nr:hypothetical protein [Lysobacter sp. CAU 1642]MCK7592330.1 hypothetical protein [Lysobacter sp. CAU 1642]